MISNMLLVQGTGSSRSLSAGALRPHEGSCRRNEDQFALSLGARCFLQGKYRRQF